jgi:hypothetical protein
MLPPAVCCRAEVTLYLHRLSDAELHRPSAGMRSSPNVHSWPLQTVSIPADGMLASSWLPFRARAKRSACNRAPIFLMAGLLDRQAETFARRWAYPAAIKIGHAGVIALSKRPTQR